jgi:type I restriction enzyme M protein
MSVRNTVKSIQDIMWKDVGVDGDAQRLSQLCWMFFLKIIDDQDQELELLRPDYKSPLPPALQWRVWAADPEGITGDDLLSFVNTELFPKLKALPQTGKPGDRRRIVRAVFEDAFNYMKSGQLMRQVINKINEIDFNDLSDRQHFGDIYEQLLNDLQSAGNAGEFYTPRAVTAFMVDRIDPHPGEILLDPACGTGGFLTCAIRHMRERYVKKSEHAQKLEAGLRAVEKKQLPHMLCVTNMLLHNIEDPGFVSHDNTLARPYISYTQSDRVDIVVTNPPFGGREADGIEDNFPTDFRTRETADLFLALIIRLLKTGGRAAVVLPDGTLFGEGVKTRLKEHLMAECNLHTIVRLPNSVFRPYASIGTNLLFFEKGEPTEDIWFYEHRVPDGQKAYSMTKPIRFEHLQGCIDWWGGAKRKGREETPQAWRVHIRAIIDEARSRAKPHWDESERQAQQEASLKARISEASAALKALENGSTSRDSGRKAKALRANIAEWQAEAAAAGETSRRERAAGDAIYAAAFNLDFKNPHTVADDHGDPEELLEALAAAEAETARLRDELRAVLAEALAR